MFDFAPDRVRKGPDLTPMIDVVFLLLVFFMLASRFSTDVVMPLAASTGQAGEWTGPPRLIDVDPGGVLRLNGGEVTMDMLLSELSRMTEAPTDAIILRAKEAPLQDLVSVMNDLGAAGYSRLILVE
ncbi:biopolymer transporter ExbD [Thioclava sp. SK-1]|uniref:ExbD/TolR family protein n=1 Tax=Thioclava sp. SK-1 TaxID=1889770 RepID=UPI000A8BC627|nr:biopolymer transporter ExbD [Thioclava sp. SK-1]